MEILVLKLTMPRHWVQYLPHLDYLRYKLIHKIHTRNSLPERNGTKQRGQKLGDFYIFVLFSYGFIGMYHILIFLFHESDTALQLSHYSLLKVYFLGPGT